jgi:hypothetical protein
MLLTFMYRSWIDFLTSFISLFECSLRSFIVFYSCLLNSLSDISANSFFVFSCWVVDKDWELSNVGDSHGEGRIIRR